MFHSEIYILISFGLIAWGIIVFPSIASVALYLKEGRYVSFVLHHGDTETTFEKKLRIVDRSFMSVGLVSLLQLIPFYLLE